MENHSLEQDTLTTRDINRLIVNSISDPVIVLDCQFSYIYVNKAAEELTGWTSEQLLGNNIFEMHGYLSGSSLEISCIKALEEQEYCFIEQYYPNYDAWTEYNIYPNHEGLVIKFKNISVNKQRENDASKLIKRNALMIETMREMFLLTDEELNVIDVNTSFCNELGYSKKELLQMNVCDFDTEPVKETVLINVKKALKAGAPYIDTKNRKKNGEIIDVELTLLKLIIDNKVHFASFGRNVTEFKKAQKELKKANLRFELIGTATQEALWEMDMETGEIWANEVHQNMYGLSKADRVPAPLEWEKRIDPGVRNKVKSGLHQAIQDKKTAWTEEYLFFTQNKGWITVYDRTHIIYDIHGKAVRSLGSMTNITDVKKAQVAMQTEKELSDSIVNSLPGIFYLVNREGKFIRWNKNFEKMSCYSAREISSIHALDLFHGKEKELLWQKIVEVFEKGESEVEANLFTKDQQKIPFYLNGRLINKHGIEYLIGMGVDMTEIKKTEKAMQQMEEEILIQKVQQQKKISRTIIKTQEAERNYIGAELHDNVNQLLAGAKLYMSIAGKKDEEIKEAIQYPMELVENAIDEIRTLTAKHVTPLKDMDLEQMVLSLVDKVKKTTEIKTSLSYDVTHHSIQPDLKINIYRIIQELTNNIIKHSTCKKAEIILRSDEESIYITVQDNGIGFSLNDKREGIGLSNIYNRVDTFNGEIDIESEPGKGCITTIKLPVEKVLGCK